MPKVDMLGGQAPAETPAPKSAKVKPPAPDTKAERIAEIIRSHLRDSPISRTDDAWNHLQSKLGAIAEDILKEA